MNKTEIAELGAKFGSLAHHEKTMTTKELAETLGVSNMAILRVLEKTNNLNDTVKVQNGKTTYFTERQATLIKQEIQKHHNLTTRNIDNVSTELEENETIFKAVSILKRRNEELEKRAELAEATNARLLHCDTTFNTSEIAKELNMPSAIFLNKELANRGCIYKDKRGLWLLTSKYSCLNYQNIKQKETNGIIIYYAEWTNEGRNWLLKMFAKDSL